MLSMGDPFREKQIRPTHQAGSFGWLWPSAAIIA